MHTHTHTNTHTHTLIQIHLKSIYTIWNSLLRGFPTQFQEIKENHQNSKIKNTMDHIFM